MAARTAAELRRHREALVSRVARAGDSADLFAQVSSRLRRVVPFDAAAWLMTDPGTGLPTGPTLLENFEGISADDCSRHWRQEFVEHDINHFRELIGAATPVGGLRAAAGDPERSRRFRTWIRPMGFGDELRAVLRVGATPWGTVTLWRRDGQPQFDHGDVELIAGLSNPIAAALRLRARAEQVEDGSTSRSDPGILLFGADDGELRSVNDAAVRLSLIHI